jgi:hypothetical protein
VEWTVFFGHLQMKLRFVNCGVRQIEALHATRKSPVALTHRVEIRSHSLSDVRTDRNNVAEHAAEIAAASHSAAEIEWRITTAPNAAPKNIAATDATLLANLGWVPFASEESAPMPVIVSVRTVVVRSGIASFRTAAFRVPIASAVRAINANG